MIYRRLWFGLHATVLRAEHALTHRPQTPAAREIPGLILHTGPRPMLTGTGRPGLSATPPPTAVHIDDHPDGSEHPAALPATGLLSAAAGTVRLPLQHRSRLTDQPLRDLLRAGAHTGHTWFTVDLDGTGIRALATRAVRDGDDVPADATWRPAALTADGLGTYYGRTCPGYRHHDGVLARFETVALRRLVADTRCSHTTVSRFFVTEDQRGPWLVDDLGDRTALRIGADGWCRLAHPALAWTGQPLPRTGPTVGVRIRRAARRPGPVPDLRRGRRSGPRQLPVDDRRRRGVHAVQHLRLCRADLSARRRPAAGPAAVATATRSTPSAALPPHQPSAGTAGQRRERGPGVIDDA